LNKFHVDWLGRDQGVRVAALVIGRLSHQSEIVNYPYRSGPSTKFSFANMNFE
jgi:hypothetical protein